MFYYDSWIADLLVFGYLFIGIYVYFFRTLFACLLLMFLTSFNPLPPALDFYAIWMTFMFIIVAFTTREGLIAVGLAPIGYSIGKGSFFDWIKRRFL